MSLQDVGWDSPYPSGQSNSPSPIPSVDTSSTLQVHNHPIIQGRTGQTPPSKQAKGQVLGQGQGQGGDDDKYISLHDGTTSLRTGDNALLPRIQTSSHSLSNGSDDNMEDSLVCSEMESEVPMSPEWFESGTTSMMNSVKGKKSEAPMSPEWFEAEALVGVAAEKKIVAPMSPEWFEAEASAMMNASAVKNIEAPMSPEWFEAEALVGAATSSSAAAAAAVVVVVEKKSDVAMPIATATAATSSSSSVADTDASATLSTASAADVLTSSAPPSKRPSLKCVVLFTPSPHPQQLPTKGLCSPPVFGDGQVKTTTLESILGDKLAPYATGAAVALPKSASASPAQSYSPPQTSAGKSSRIPVFDGKSWKVARSTDVSPIRSPSEEPLGTKSPHMYDAPLRKAVMEPLPAASSESMNDRSPRVYSMPQKKLHMDPLRAVTGDNNAEAADRIYSLPLRRAGTSSADVSPIHTPPVDLSGYHTASLGKDLTEDAIKEDRDLVQAVNSASTTSQGPRGQGDDLSYTQSTFLTAPVTKLLASMTGDNYSSGNEVDNTFLSAPATSSTTRPPRPADGLKILISPKAGADMIPHPENPELVKPPTPVGSSWPAMEEASDGTAQGDIIQGSCRAASTNVNLGTGTGAGVAKVVSGTAAVAVVGGLMSAAALPGSPAFKLPPLETPSLSPLLESLLADSPLRDGLPSAPESDRISRTYSGEGTDRSHNKVGTTGASPSHHIPSDHSHYDVDEEDDEEDDSSTVTTIVSKGRMRRITRL